jgi:hypothetical protein
MDTSESPAHAAGVALHFAFASDVGSVVQQGILSQYLRQRLGQSIAAGPFKAQRQVGPDLISIWDPWAFLRRHWRNCPTGSENRPWLILDMQLQRHFDSVADLGIASAIRDPDPASWVAVAACQAAVPRKRLDMVRRRLARVAAITGPAPGVTVGAIRHWIDSELSRRFTSDASGESEVCFLVSPATPRYDFPGYKQFENFARYRIAPRRLLGAVVGGPAGPWSDAVKLATAVGLAVYLPDGTRVNSP